MNEHLPDHKITLSIVQEIIYRAIDDFNESMPSENRFLKKPDTVIYDGSQMADTLILTVLIVAIEQKIEEELKISISLVNDNAIWQDRGAFYDINALSRFVLELLEKKHV